MKIDILPDIKTLSKIELEAKAKENSQKILDPGTGCDFDSSFPLIHATTVDRAVNILDSGKIKPYDQLLREGNQSVLNNIDTYTDVLDEFIGTDTYMFASLGKSHVRDDIQRGNVFFMFNPKVVSQQVGLIISIKEIAELGGIVSKEGAQVYMREESLSEKDIQQRNKNAIEAFYSQVLTWNGFEKSFCSMLEHNPHFIGQATYSGEELDIGTKGKQTEVRNYWQGYQFMIPNELPISKVQTIVCTDKPEKKKLAGMLSKKQIKGPQKILYTLDEMKSKFNSIFKDQGEINQYDLLLVNTFLYLLHNRITSVDNILEYLRQRI